jgi:hypothetical protein
LASARVGRDRVRGRRAGHDVGSGGSGVPGSGADTVIAAFLLLEHDSLGHRGGIRLGHPHGSIRHAKLMVSKQLFSMVVRGRVRDAPTRQRE